jgi:hypothetical protein
MARQPPLPPEQSLVLVLDDVDEEVLPKPIVA